MDKGYENIFYFFKSYFMIIFLILYLLYKININERIVYCLDEFLRVYIYLCICNLLIFFMWDFFVLCVFLYWMIDMFYVLFIIFFDRLIKFCLLFFLLIINFLFDIKFWDNWCYFLDYRDYDVKVFVIWMFEYYWWMLWLFGNVVSNGGIFLLKFVCLW